MSSKRRRALAALEHSIGWCTYLLCLHEDITRSVKKKPALTLIELRDLEQAVKNMYKQRGIMRMFPAVEEFSMYSISECSGTIKVLNELGINMVDDLLGAGVGLPWMLGIQGCVPMPYELVLLHPDGRELLQLY